MSEVVKSEDILLMEENRLLKQKMLKKYMKNFDGEDDIIDEDQIHAFVRLADSIDDSVVKATKLKISEEANQIAKGSQEQGIALLKSLHRADERAYASFDGNKDVPDNVFLPTGETLTPGETLGGLDTETLDTFRERNPNEG